MFANSTLGKVLIFKVCKELNSIAKKHKIIYKHLAKDLNKHFLKEDVQMVDNHMKKIFNITKHQRNSS